MLRVSFTIDISVNSKKFQLKVSFMEDIDIEQFDHKVLNLKVEIACDRWVRRLISFLSFRTSSYSLKFQALERKLKSPLKSPLMSTSKLP